LLLDQDRVHPSYLREALLKFGFPSILVDSLCTHLRLNINGVFFSHPIPRDHGLRQGNYISTILFNLAFEPLFRKILSDSSFSGFKLPSSNLPILNLKICVFTNETSNNGILTNTDHVNN
ncbi:hypothetical protein BD770DRAFT_461811, partial [Pilaira anomala]